MNFPVSADERLGAQIIREAGRFVGLREVKPNAVWDDPATHGPDALLSAELSDLMRPSPWLPGWAYCAAFCEGVVSSALEKTGRARAEVRRFREVMSPHCVSAAAAFKKRGLLDDAPCAGAIWLARHRGTSNGHAGIVTAVRGVSLSTIEANTSLDVTNPEKDREGDWITTRLFHARGRGSLETLGFVTPADILKLVRGNPVPMVHDVK